jgi:hypothetical protein
MRALAQRVENVARWIGGRQGAVPQYHLWMFRDEEIGRAIQALYDDADPSSQREKWQWLLEWTPPVRSQQSENR